ncbi:endonuclease/exonuclease/phosphatase family protein [Devosia sediminis]|uniref:Endonuclease/exonuclease/phosphatase family protein n=1 Tax=Devosia sediminis TaxID=2798801 RepID=A0A934IWZ7_9HYPH|nr:endonuclease/exonuclease/phosphatase family protein [Devosia sediminis]MBJ3783837.1 endonuclease/exonuclease/phosphatase family protein [Devosia sediminis]
MLSWGEFRGGLLALAGLLLLVFAVIVVQPGLPGEQLLQTLRFHLVAAGFGLALLLALTGALWRSLVLGILVAAMAVHSATYVVEFQSRRLEQAASPAARFDFLSYNVLAFNSRAEEMVQSILSDPPDVALIMESRAIRPYLDQLAEVLPYRIGCDAAEACDISLHSRFPFESRGLEPLSSLWGDRYVAGGIVVDGQPVTVVGLHLTKPYYDDIAEFELDRASRWMGRIEGPLVVAGDFNAAPWSDAVAEFGRAQGLASGPTIPATWPVRLGPLGVPIDNMFTRGNALIMSLSSGENHGSNHRPLRAEIGLYGAD